MERAKYAIRNSKGIYAGAGNTVILQLDNGFQVVGTIKSIQFASDIVFTNGKSFNVTQVVDFMPM